MIPYREAWGVDFEFRSLPGERPHVWCMSAREYYSGRHIRMWRDELLALRQAPFGTGPDTLLVAFYTSAEISCILELWGEQSVPANTLDLFAENRCNTNGRPLPMGLGNGLLDVLTLHGLGHIDAGEKKAMRDLATRGEPFTAEDKAALQDYCDTDTAALMALLPRMAPFIDWTYALPRGRYMHADARMCRAGIPIDMSILRRLESNWDAIKLHLISDVDKDFGIYEGTTFKQARFEAYLDRHERGWPRHPSGELKLDTDTFDGMAELHPDIRPLQELVSTLGSLRLSSLCVGADGRNRDMLSAYNTVTSRNSPSTSKFVFGAARWLRGLIKPPEGYGIAYVDWKSQEVAISAALSGDQVMMNDYQSGDVYLTFAKSINMVPPDATKKSHKEKREVCKRIVLGVPYGMGPYTMAVTAGITPCEAQELLRLHRIRYKQFWAWSDSTVDDALRERRMISLFGWRRMLDDDVRSFGRKGTDGRPRVGSVRSLMNWPIQTAGAEMMRMAAIVATETGIEVCMPVHDAFLICSPLDRLDADVDRMMDIMGRAGQVVTGGFDVGVEAEIVRYPDRYMDDRGAAMWDRIMGLLDLVEAGQELAA